ncbi:disease resistance protein RGA2-like [Panicum miliaceum]|uniref:Disease resistance protein RGA2-like n=1 Tax=Panicum miliaceum TaxID=4540 RepID=A0A3L6RRT5_PANMI|nr:disease resistance protein RGA2-like [Panicum miliaceum]
MAAAAAAFAGKGIATSVISYIINKAFDYLKDNKKDAGLKSTKKRLEELVPQFQVVYKWDLLKKNKACLRPLLHLHCSTLRWHASAGTSRNSIVLYHTCPFTF